jgi:uncharacterized RDD family membrane protein YckC
MEDMIRHGNAHICAACKPIFIQRLAEGADIRTGMRFVGFWWRFLASILDGIAMIVLNIAVGLLAGMSMLRASGLDRINPIALIVTQLLGMAIAISYETFFIGRFGATPGKMLCKIKVVTADGGRVSYARALGRYFAKILSGVTIGIGYIMAAFDTEKRALHDRICNTRVIDASSFKSDETFR